MNRLLLLTASHSYRAGAFLNAARAIGVPVTVGTDRRQVLARLHPEGNLELDFEDPPRMVEAILEFAERVPIHAVVAADDDGALPAAMAGAALGLRHVPIEAVMSCRDKFLMRVTLERAGRPGPRFERVPLSADPESVAARTDFPCVLKPIALAASRGVIRADDRDGWIAAFHRITRLLARADARGLGPSTDHFLLVEDYLPGAEVAVEGLITHGRLRVLAIFDKPDPLEGPFFEETIYVTPSRRPEAEQRAIVEETAAAAAALGLSDGPLHAELRVHQGRATVLEIAPRSIGGLCSRTLRFGTGASLEELILRHALGLEGAGMEREAGAAGVMMLPIGRAGVLQAVRGQDQARAVPGIEDLRLTIPLGTPVEPLPEGARYLGFLFARADAPGEVEAALREAHRRLDVSIVAPQGAAAEQRVESS
jgi:biotin carboxylase